MQLIHSLSSRHLELFRNVTAECRVAFRKEYSKVKQDQQERVLKHNTVWSANSKIEEFTLHVYYNRLSRVLSRNYIRCDKAAELLPLEASILGFLFFFLLNKAQQ